MVGAVSQFAVVTVRPPGYAHAEAFAEVGETLLHALRRLGHDAVVADHPVPGRRAIVLGSNLLPRHPLPLDPGDVLYNLEQVEERSPWLGPELRALFRRHPVWDYSARNAARYPALGLPAPVVVPIGWAPELARIAPAAVEDVDVLFYGSVNERRRGILEALAARGLRVEARFGLYGAERDALIARSKIVLNVHFYEAKVFEEVRVSYLLGNGRCVVSERGADPEAERAFEGGVAFADHDRLVETCAALAADPGARARLAARGREIMASRDAARILHPFVGGAVPPPPASDPPRPGDPPRAGGEVRPPPPSPDAPRSPPMLPELPPPTSIEDLLSLARPSGRRVLLVGCGDGRTGEALRAAGAVEVVGLEARAIAAVARSRVNAVCRVELSTAPALPWPDGYFDLAVVEDLAAQAEPVEALRHLRRWLADDARLVCVVPNPRHEAALAHLLVLGRWPGGAGARPLSIGEALSALGAAGYAAEDEVIAVQGDPGAAAAALAAAIAALGGDAARAAEDLRLARVLVAARPSVARGEAPARALPDPWRGSRPVKVLVAPDLSEPADSWQEALPELARGLAGNPQVTLAVALPSPLLDPPPAVLVSLAEQGAVDLLLIEAPVDDAGWERLLAGTSTWIATSAHPQVAAAAARAGATVQRS